MAQKVVGSGTDEGQLPSPYTIKGDRRGFLRAGAALLAGVAVGGGASHGLSLWVDQGTGLVLDGEYLEGMMRRAVSPQRIRPFGFDLHRLGGNVPQGETMARLLDDPKSGFFIADQGGYEFTSYMGGADSRGFFTRRYVSKVWDIMQRHRGWTSHHLHDTIENVASADARLDAAAQEVFGVDLSFETLRVIFDVRASIAANMLNKHLLFNLLGSFTGDQYANPAMALAVIAHEKGHKKALKKAIPYPRAEDVCPPGVRGGYVETVIKEGYADKAGIILCEAAGEPNAFHEAAAIIYTRSMQDRWNRIQSGGWADDAARHQEGLDVLPDWASAEALFTYLGDPRGAERIRAVAEHFIKPDGSKNMGFELAPYEVMVAAGLKTLRRVELPRH